MGETWGDERVKEDETNSKSLLSTASNQAKQQVFETEPSLNRTQSLRLYIPVTGLNCASLRAESSDLLPENSSIAGASLPATGLPQADLLG